jgi:hypothetical protein
MNGDNGLAIFSDRADKARVARQWGTTKREKPPDEWGSPSFREIDRLMREKPNSNKNEKRGKRA